MLCFSFIYKFLIFLMYNSAMTGDSKVSDCVSNWVADFKLCNKDTNVVNRRDCWNNKREEQPKGGISLFYPMVLISILTFCWWRFFANIVLKLRVEFYRKQLTILLCKLFVRISEFTVAIYRYFLNDPFTLSLKKSITLYVDIVLICIDLHIVWMVRRQRGVRSVLERVLLQKHQPC